MTEPSLAELAQRFGVACVFEDWSGQTVPVDDATVIAALAALGVCADTEEDRANALAEQDRRHWSRSLPPTIVVRSGREATFWVHVTHGAPAHVWVRMEDGTV
ncbi:MAG: 4-alpha-glucanotransferase, partial [Mycobacterium sp.]